MAIDYYAYAKDIAAGLDDVGYKKHAIDIREAIEYGSTSTEILMALRFISNSHLYLRREAPARDEPVYPEHPEQSQRLT